MPKVIAARMRRSKLASLSRAVPVVHRFVATAASALKANACAAKRSPPRKPNNSSA